MTFKDHFSRHAADYAAARPTYPAALFDWLSETCQHHELAWDAGCGNGQASLALAHHFQRVHASDPSDEQIAQAPPDARIHWRVEPAERCSLPDHSADLVTVAQAYHWFNHARFCAEATRVLRPGGVIALWCYGLTHVDEAVDAVFRELYDIRLGDAYWPPERRHVENGYRELPFPFEPISDVPRFTMRLDWTLTQYLAYLRSWSASQKYLRETGRDAVGELAGDFAAAWGEPEATRSVSWPLSLRVGRTPDP
ncbi:class I SAM-dependent methyltransferase [Arenimonas terrae]|jgi:SAM-dependent methyltransferase|uniref:Class I SAM-dependent methyltransferase n=1 Tax=Arenimonas terrae TaxID=2546226 RepID=A0A5C4RQ38_9GAMM|nr:class I SAM-dependent methyltransferase [Arenimonas terrae]TNJ33363.1 class I SAM-dependent methyltransferase [Arenimonas terrae]